MERTIEKLEGETTLKGHHDHFGSSVQYTAKLDLLVVSIARDLGCPFLQVEDWSILRDADPEEHQYNLAAALNFLEGLSAR